MSSERARENYTPPVVAQILQNNTHVASHSDSTPSIICSVLHVSLDQAVIFAYYSIRFASIRPLLNINSVLNVAGMKRLNMR